MKSLINNVASQFIGRILTSATTFSTTFLIAYFFGFSLYGSFTKITALVTLFYLVVDFGLNGIFLKEYIGETEQNFGRLLSLRVFISTILFFIILFLVFLFPHNQTTNTGFSNQEKIGVIIFSFTLYTQAVWISVSSIFQKHLKYSLSIIPLSLYSLSLLVGVVVAFLINNFYLLLFSYILAGFVLSVTGIAILKKNYSILFNTHDLFNFSKKIIKASFPLALMLLLNAIYFRIDTLILSFYRSSTDVGIYGFSYRVFEFIISFPTFFTNSVYPILLAEQNNTLFNKLLKKYFLTLFVLSIFAALLSAFLFPFIGLIKESFKESITPFQILLFSLPFFFLTSLLQWVLVIRNKKKFLVVIYCIALSLNIILNIYFIPKFSYIASAWITVLNEAVVFGLLLLALLLPAAKNTGKKS